MKSEINIAIFASGSGSNAENIANYFIDNDQVKINLILSNNKNAYVLERAKKKGIPNLLVQKKEYNNEAVLLGILKDKDIDYIVLAGFLWLIPSFLIKAYRNSIINIHPSLLPKFGGKGMYGMHVHEAVKLSNEKESGITIHLVNEEYDKGEILFQNSVALAPEDSPEQIAEKVHALEYEYFPKVIEKHIRKIKLKE